MNTNLDNEEFKITSLIIRNAIAHAAQSLSTLLKDEVKLYKLDLIDRQENKMPFHMTDDGKVCFLMKTAIFGEFRAQSNLIITEKEAQKIWEITQPDNFSMQEEMRDAILLEMDNILTAAVVSEIANILQINVFGGVPEIQKVEASQVKQVMTLKEEEYEYQFILDTVFLCKMTQINPSFIWFFQHELLENIKKVIKNPENYPGISEIKEKYLNQSS